LLALLLTARSNSKRLGLRWWTKAATSRRSPNAVAPAKPPAGWLCLVFASAKHVRTVPVHSSVLKSPDCSRTPRPSDVLRAGTAGGDRPRSG
jgi:hypothetical protein